MASARAPANIFGPPPSGEFVVEPSPGEIAYFREMGFLPVERLTTDEEIAWIRRIMEYIFDPANADQEGAPIDRSGTRQDGESSTLQQSFFPEIRTPELLQTNHYKNAKRYAAALLDVPIETISAWGHMIRKPVGGRSAPWHQDHAYWQPEMSYHALGCWTPLHDVSVEMGAMQFIPGSHKRGLLPHRHVDKPEHNLLEVTAPHDKDSAVACPLRAGGATFHHYDTLHYTAPNTTAQPRLAFPMEFQQDPVLREMPLDMPWVDQTRAVVGQGATLLCEGRRGSRPRNRITRRRVDFDLPPPPVGNPVIDIGDHDVGFYRKNGYPVCTVIPPTGLVERGLRRVSRPASNRLPRRRLRSCKPSGERASAGCTRPPSDPCPTRIPMQLESSSVTKITDVAKAAGVSPATVSRVLNGTSRVSAELTNKVREAADKLRYVPFSSARVLRRQNAAVWAAIVSDIESPFFSSVVRGIEDVARDANHRLVLCNSDEDLERESDYPDVAVAERMAGVVIAVASSKHRSLKALNRARHTSRRDRTLRRTRNRCGGRWTTGWARKKRHDISRKAATAESRASPVPPRSIRRTTGWKDTNVRSPNSTKNPTTAS